MPEGVGPPGTAETLLMGELIRPGGPSMAKTETSPLLQLIRRVVVDPRVSGCTDQQLTERYLAGRDEDAFRAAFLALAQKAGSIKKAGSLASWLHGVAYRVARIAQEELARRQKHQECVPERAWEGAADAGTWREVRQVVHKETGGLPERLRAPLLCYLRGMTQDEAAAELGLPKGTPKGRLESGRALLRARLAGRGLGPGAPLVLAAWPAVTAWVGQVSSAVRSATGLAAGRAFPAWLPPACFSSPRGC